MGVTKKTLSFPVEVWSFVEDEARQAGTTPSAYVSEVLAKNARIQRGLRAVDEYEAEYGPIPQDILEWADRVTAIAMNPATYEMSDDDEDGTLLIEAPDRPS